MCNVQIILHHAVQTRHKLDRMTAEEALWPIESLPLPSMPIVTGLLGTHSLRSRCCFHNGPRREFDLRKWMWL